MTKRHLVKSLKTLALAVAATAMLGTTACGINMFWPKAQLRILEIKPDREVSKSVEGLNFKFNFIGIFQAVTKPQNLSTLLVEYELVDPVITFQNRERMPRVTFEKGIVEYDLRDIQLPRKEFAINQTLSEGSSGAAGEKMQIRLVSGDSDLEAAVFPGNSKPRVSEGVAFLTLIGKDFNGNQITVDVPIPMRFQSTGLIERAPAPGSTPAPTPGR